MRFAHHDDEYAIELLAGQTDLHGLGEPLQGGVAEDVDGIGVAPVGRQNLVELGFAEDVHYKDAYKKINWSIFEYDMVQYISEIKKSGKTDIVKAVNVLIVNYDSGKDHNGDYRMLRRAYEI